MKDVSPGLSPSVPLDSIVPQLERWLRDDNRAVRLEAAHALAACREAGLQALVAALDDERQDVRRQAAYGLGETKNERAVPALTTALDDDDLAYFAIYALGQLGRDGVASAVQPLVRTLDHPEGCLRARAAGQLGLMKAIEAVPRLRVMLTDPHAMVRGWVIDALAEIGDREAIPQLIEILPNADRDLRYRIIRALPRLDARQEMIAPLLLCLADESASIGGEAARALAVLGEPSVQPLLEVAQHGSAIARAWALSALARLHNSRALDVALIAIQDDNTAVRAQAAYALGSISDPRGFEPLVRAIEDPEKRVRASATFALRSFGPQAFEPLVQVYLQYGIGFGAARALADLGDPRVFDFFLDGPDGRGSDSFPLGLTGLVRQSLPLQKRLYDALKAPHPKVRRSAVVGLGYLRESWTWEPIVGMLHDKNADVRRGALGSLVLVNRREALPFLIAALKDDDQQVRYRAAIELRHDDVDWRDGSLLSLFDDPDVEVRHLAARRLAEFGGEEALAALSSRLVVESGISSKGISVKEEMIRATKRIQIRSLLAVGSRRR
jgi:HEAT repeat protein